MSEKYFSGWLLSEWNHTILNIYYSSTSSTIGARSALPVYIYFFIVRNPIILQMIFVDS